MEVKTTYRNKGEDVELKFDNAYTLGEYIWAVMRATNTPGSITVYKVEEPPKMPEVIS